MSCSSIATSVLQTEPILPLDQAAEALKEAGCTNVEVNRTHVTARRGTKTITYEKSGRIQVNGSRIPVDQVAADVRGALETAGMQLIVAALGEMGRISNFRIVEGSAVFDLEIA